MAETKKTQKSIAQYDLAGAAKGETVATEAIFNKKVTPVLLAQYVRMYQVNQRQGNASTKTRAEINGTTKKVYKQKGTGNARHGSKKAPIFKGGGVVGGPKPKDYRLYMNKKQRKQALFGSLTMKFTNGDVVSLEIDTKADAVKTKLFSSFLTKLAIADKKTLFIIPKTDESKFVLALRNLKNASYSSVVSLNAYDILNAAKVVFVGSAIKELETHFLGTNEN